MSYIRDEKTLTFDYARDSISQWVFKHLAIEKRFDKLYSSSTTPEKCRRCGRKKEMILNANRYAMQNTVLLKMCSKFCLIDKKLASFVVLESKTVRHWTESSTGHFFFVCEFWSNWNQYEFESSAKQTFFHTTTAPTTTASAAPTIYKKKRKVFVFFSLVFVIE